jgi:3-phytase
MEIKPVLATEPVATDADDPAVWVHPADPRRSLILGTDKVAVHGAVVVFDLDGKIRQTIPNLDRPNNIDVEYGMKVGAQATDIAVFTERLKHRLRVLRIPHNGGPLVDISSDGGIPVFAGEPGRRAEPMGVALYKRPGDGAIFAIISRSEGPAEGYLWQYRLDDDGAGKVNGTLVRKFGAYSGTKEIESVAVDDELGYVYYGDELAGIRKYHADPDHPDAGRELAFFGRDGFRGDREGIGIYRLPGGKGFIVATDQLDGNSTYHLFRREGRRGNPHDHSETVRIVRGGADATDGLEVTSAPLGPKFPRGLMVAMNSRGRNFLVYRWEDVAGARR